MSDRRVSFLLVVPALFLLAATGCHDDPEPLPVIVEGAWLATVVETSDSCDDVIEPVMELSVDVTDEGDSHFVWIYDLASDDCWVQPFQLAEDTLSWSNGQVMEHDCSAGCSVQVDSTVTLEFHEGGLYTGTETLTFTPLNAACDDPNCAFPCGAQDRHLVFPPLGDGCGFACETTYTWAGAITADPPSRTCN